MSGFSLAWRSVRRSPGFAVAAVLILAAGIGANTLVFSIVRPVLLQAGPYPNPHELSTLSIVLGPDGRLVEQAKAGDYIDWKREQTAFAAMALHRAATLNLTGVDPPLPVRATTVTASFFDVLGVAPYLGRVFGEAEERDRVAVLSHGFWVRHFAGNPNAVGRNLILNDAAFRVIGVMPPAFEFPRRDNDLLIPLAIDPAEVAERVQFRFLTIARRKPGVGAEQAGREMRAIAARLRRVHPVKNEFVDVAVREFDAAAMEKPGRALRLMSCAVLAVLAIAIANAAGLILARAARRRAALLIRLALGASRWRLVGDALVESLTLALMGGALGVLAAWAGLGAVLHLVPIDVPRIQEVRVDAAVLGFAFALSVLTGVAAGIVPALRETGAGPRRPLSARGASADRGATRWREALVAIEVALAVVLLAGAGLLLRSFRRVVETDLGFDAQGVYSVRYALPKTRYPNAARTNAFHDRLLAEASAIPRVTAAGLISNMPFDASLWTGPMQVSGRAESEQRKAHVDHRAVSPGYFAAMGIALSAGRLPNGADRENTRPVVVVDRTVARLYFPGENPLGKVQPGVPAMGFPWSEIVGVVEDVRANSAEAASRGAVYAPYPQRPRDAMALVVRTADSPASVAGAVREAFRRVDPAQPVFQETTFAALIERSLGQRRFLAQVTGALAAIALALAVAGLYALLAQTAAGRVWEFGLRLALGSGPWALAGLVAGRAIVAVGAGLAAGGAVVAAGSRLLAGFLYETPPADPLALSAAAVAILSGALAAAAIPGWRAARTDPAVALRETAE